MSYILPRRQRRRNNYSRTILADRATDLLPQLSRKQLLSVRKLLISAGLVNQVNVQTITYNQLVRFPTGTEYSGTTPYIIPLVQSGLHLNRVVVRRRETDTNLRRIYYGVNSKPDGTGTSYAANNLQLSSDVMIQYPDAIRPFLFYTSPANVSTDAYISNYTYIRSQPVASDLKYYPLLYLYFATDNLPQASDYVVCILYYTN